MTEKKVVCVRVKHLRQHRVGKRNQFVFRKLRVVAVQNVNSGNSVLAGPQTGRFFKMVFQGREVRHNLNSGDGCAGWEGNKDTV